MIKRVLVVLALVVIALGGLAAYALYLDPRPPDTTAARVYAEDPSLPDYCDLPVLDGSAATADQIPKAYTPGCRATRWPAPVLAGCTEPLPEGAEDLRGLWHAYEGQVGHVERIEQCGDRVVVSGRTFIHDFRTTGEVADGANDVNPILCTRVRAAMEWRDGTLEFRPWGLTTLVTRRLLDADTLEWVYPGQPTSVMRRICRLPDANA